MSRFVKTRKNEWVNPDWVALAYLTRDDILVLEMTHGRRDVPPTTITVAPDCTADVLRQLGIDRTE